MVITRRQAATLAIAAVVLALAYWLRFAVHEDEALAAACVTAAAEGRPASWLCAPRASLAAAAHFLVPGWTAVGLAAGALLQPRWLPPALALAAAAVALVFYNPTLGGVALVGGLIAAARHA